MTDWRQHVIRTGLFEWADDTPPEDPSAIAGKAEPWISSLLQAEHLNLLIGSGLTIGLAEVVGKDALRMDPVPIEHELAESLYDSALENASQSGREVPNIEDQVRAILNLIDGLKILSHGSLTNGRHWLDEWQIILDDVLSSFLRRVLRTEKEIDAILSSDGESSERARRLLRSFLLTFSSRTASRERLHVFTTNYDRCIEHGCDLLGLRVIDRFVGALTPVYRASRLGVDFHYNPPGIRGEPRYLEGVIRLTKLHGSVDWRAITTGGVVQIRREGIPFGSGEEHPSFPDHPAHSLMIYPNPAKDMETSEYPYADLFRDFAEATCRPNTVIMTYGYGFGDDHINRILEDMLTISSTHLVIMSYDSAGGRIKNFVERIGAQEQITLLIGSHFGDLRTLTELYLPKPAIDRNTWRMVDLMNRRTPSNEVEEVVTKEASTTIDPDTTGED